MKKGSSGFTIGLYLIWQMGNGISKMVTLRPCK